MMKDQAGKICDFLTEWGIKAVIFFVPLYFAIIYRDYSVFSLDKVVLFRSLVEVLLILTLVKLILAKTIFVHIDKRHLLIFLPFFLSFFIATLFSPNPAVSFWGSYWRLQGLFTYLHYLAFFLILVIHSADINRLDKMINTALWASLLISLFGVMQWLGLDPLPWQRPIFLGGRITATFGQPVFLANYLLLVIFLTGYKIITSREFLAKFLLTLLLILQLSALIFTGTRGAWLGLLAGLALLSTALVFRNWPANKIKVIKISLACLALMAALVLFIGLVAPNNSFLSPIYWRVKSMSQIQSGSMAMRARYWLASLAAFQAKPWLGYGPENQQTALMKYYNPLWSVDETINSIPDRTHNEFLDLLLNGGVLLAAAYLIIVVFIAWRGFKIIKKKQPGDHLLIFLLTGWLAYLSAILFSFSEIESSVYAWFYLAAILLVVNGFREERFVEIKTMNSKYFHLLIFAVSCSVLGLIYLANLNINAVRADYYFRQARVFYSRKDYLKMFNQYLAVRQYNPGQEYYRWFMAQDLMDSLNYINSPDYKKTVLNYLQSTLGDNYLYIRDFAQGINNARILSALGAAENKKYFSQAQDLYQRLAANSPFYPETYRAWAMANLQAGDYKKAVKIFKISLEVLPDLSDPLFNLEHKRKIQAFQIEVYQNLAFCYFKLNNLDLAIEYNKKISYIDPYNTAVYRNLAEIYKFQGDTVQAMKYYQRGLALAPADPGWQEAIDALKNKQEEKKIINSKF